MPCAASRAAIQVTPARNSVGRPAESVWIQLVTAPTRYPCSRSRPESRRNASETRLFPPSPLSTRNPPARSPIRAVSTPWRSRYSVSVPRSRPVSGPTTRPITGTPSSTTTASSGDTDHSSPATTAYATTAPTPGPTAVSDWAITCTSPTPMVTTSPAPVRRSSEAPSRTVCPTTTFTVRKLASMRTRVMVRCRMMLSQELNPFTANSAPVHSASAPVSPGARPSSTARAIR